MATANNKTMFNYFTKLPPKVPVSDENPRKSAPEFNRQHKEEFQERIETFDQLLSNPKPDCSYLISLRSQEHKPFRLSPTPRGANRVRLLQFAEDVRPPYFGTWRKTSTAIKGRRPFAQDDEVFDYDIDSEAEWDIGGPGESLKGDDSEDEEEADDYEIDMKTFVPHGYVSDDEADNTDNEDNPSKNQTNNRCLEMDLNNQPGTRAPVIIGLNFGSRIEFLQNFNGISI